MKAGPITFHNLQFIRVHVEAEFEAQTAASDFAFEGTKLCWGINHGREDNGRWWVGVAFNTADDEKPDKRCPYNIDVQAVGFFSISDQIQADKHEAMIFENGGELVFSAIREMVADITARSVPGQLMLPTPTFAGSFSERNLNK
jgi:preprotein translocase subunit SecB